MSFRENPKFQHSLLTDRSTRLYVSPHTQKQHFLVSEGNHLSERCKKCKYQIPALRAGMPIWKLLAILHPTDWLNDPTQFEQADETWGLGGAILCPESLGMTGISVSGALKQIWDTKIQTVSKRSRKRANWAIRTRMSHLTVAQQLSSIWHGVRFFNVRWGRLVL